MELDETIQKLIQEHNFKLAEFTEAQFVDALKQALQSGDFVRFVQEGGGAQNVTYIPFYRQYEKDNKIREMEEALEDIYNKSEDSWAAARAERGLGRGKIGSYTD